MGMPEQNERRDFRDKAGHEKSQRGNPIRHFCFGPIALEGLGPTGQLSGAPWVPYLFTKHCWRVRTVGGMYVI